MCYFEIIDRDTQGLIPRRIKNSLGWSVTAFSGSLVNLVMLLEATARYGDRASEFQPIYWWLLLCFVVSLLVITIHVQAYIKIGNGMTYPDFREWWRPRGRKLLVASILATYVMCVVLGVMIQTLILE